MFDAEHYVQTFGSLMRRHDAPDDPTRRIQKVLADRKEASGRLSRLANRWYRGSPITLVIGDPGYCEPFSNFVNSYFVTGQIHFAGENKC